MSQNPRTPAAASPATDTPADASANRRPIHRIRLGYCQAAIWENETPHGPRHAVALERLYTDADGKWQRTRSFNASDLPTLAALLHLAIADLHHRRSDPWEGE